MRTHSPSVRSVVKRSSQHLTTVARYSNLRRWPSPLMLRRPTASLRARTTSTAWKSDLRMLATDANVQQACRANNGATYIQHKYCRFKILPCSSDCPFSKLRLDIPNMSRTLVHPSDGASHHTNADTDRSARTTTRLACRHTALAL